MDATDATAAAATLPATGTAQPAAKEPKLSAENANLLTQRRNGRWYLDLRGHGGKREALIPEGSSYGTKSRLVALSLAAKRLEEVLLPESERHFRRRLVPRPMPIGEWAYQWCERAKQMADNGGASLETIRRYEQALAQLFRKPAAVPDGTSATARVVAMNPDMLAHHVTRADVKAALRTLRGPTSPTENPLSAASVHQIITAMGMIYDDAADEGILPEGHNPWRSLRKRDRPRLPESNTDFLEIYEAYELLVGCVGRPAGKIPLYPITATWLHTGGRKNEVLGLEWCHIDLVAKTVRFVKNKYRRIKTRNARTVPLTPELERILCAHCPDPAQREGLIFPGYSRTGKPQMITSYARALHEAKCIAVAHLRERGLEIEANRLAAKAVNTRVFRVTYCSARLQTLDRGVPIAKWTVECEMGHNSAKMIEHVYGRLGTHRHRGEHVEYVPRNQ